MLQLKISLLIFLIQEQIKRDNDNIFAADGYKRNIIKVFDINKTDYIFGLDGIRSACYALDFSVGSTFLDFGCADRALRIIDI